MAKDDGTCPANAGETCGAPEVQGLWLWKVKVGGRGQFSRSPPSTDRTSNATLLVWLNGWLAAGQANGGARQGKAGQGQNRAASTSFQKESTSPSCSMLVIFPALL